ncbi:unnamed protein product [Symbiodinium pilosum]|uniref:Uncharacterized protein n=1 Tax=Symbiodinium pilosum TaxID=2952 RepID=A0A812QYS9_SYMPI|nr:unnamed protein product [Symbiodinium pilosum]
MSWQSGVAASFLGSFSGTLGTQLRISSLAQDVAGTARLLQACGWTFWLAGQGLGQVAILLAPASLTASVNFSGSLLSNALLAPLVLNEKLTRLHWLSVVLLVVGSGMVTSSSSHADQKYSYLQLCQLAHRPTFLTCASIISVLTVLCLCRALRKRALELLSFAYIFALIGAIDLLVTKFTLQLLRLVVVGKEEDTPAERIVSCFVTLTVTLHVGVFFCQVAAAYYRKALKSLPLFLGSGALMQVLLCGIFFDEFSQFGMRQQVSFSSGFLLVMLGMVATSVATTANFRDEVSSPESVVPELPDLEAAKDAVTTEPPARPTAPSNMTPSSHMHSAVITSGLLERSSSSMSSADLLLLGDIQRSALCFGGRYAAGRFSTSKISLHRRFASDNFLLMPLVENPVEGKWCHFFLFIRIWSFVKFNGALVGQQARLQERVSATLTPASDLFVQKQQDAPIDKRRLQGFFLLGVVQGVTSWLVYVSLFTRCFPLATRLVNLPLKEKLKDWPGLWQLGQQIVFDLAVYVPLVHFPVFYCVQGACHGESVSSSISRWQTNFWQDAAGGAMFWLPLDVLCFTVPMWLRMPIGYFTTFWYAALLSVFRGSELPAVVDERK